AGMNMPMNRMATKPSANAIGMPENMTTSVTAPNSRPMVRTLMCAQGSFAVRFCRFVDKVADALQGELDNEQRHAGRHQAVRNRQRWRERRRGRHLVDPGLMKQ